jgi:hypothetical protein
MFVILVSDAKMCLMIFFSSQAVTFRIIRIVASVKEKGISKV